MFTIQRERRLRIWRRIDAVTSQGFCWNIQVGPITKGESSHAYPQTHQ